MIECEACEDDALVGIGLTNAHHALLAKERARAEEAEKDLDQLCAAVLSTVELYAEPIRYKVRGQLKPNFSIGFETRFQAMYELADSLAPKKEGT